MSTDGDDYLWDRSGDAPPDVRSLEVLLASLRSRRPAPEMPASSLVSDLPAPHARWHTWAVAASLALAVVAPWIAERLTPDDTQWGVEWLSSPRAGAEARGLRAGDSLDTGTGRARVEVGKIGTVDLEPGTRVRIVDAGTTHHRMSLERGAMNARIWAPPGQFLVDTPSAQAVDLGCQYRLEVTEAGAGVLHVEVGWVGFAHGRRRVLVPGGAIAHTRPGVGPGTPYVEDAAAELVAALDVIDFDTERGPSRRAALAKVLATAREEDALTLWHLLAHVDAPERAIVFDRFAQLVPPPPGVARDGIVRGDGAMLDAWWNVLGLGSAADWQQWTTPWPVDTTGSSR